MNPLVVLVLFISATYAQADRLTDLRALIRGSSDLAGFKSAGDDVLQKFLDARGQDTFKTYELMKGYVRMRRDHPEAFMMASEAVRLYQPSMFTLTNDTTPLGERIIYGRPSNWDYRRFYLQQNSATIIPFLEYEAADPNSALRKNGAVLLLDMREWTPLQTAYTRMWSLRLIIQMSERALPVRFRQIHVLFNSRVSDVILPVATPLMSHELRDSFVYHGSDLTSLYRVIPRNSLPFVLGGDKPLRTFSSTELAQIDEKLKQIWSFV